MGKTKTVKKAKKVAPKFNANSAYRRLLDMLAGWSEFASNDMACMNSGDEGDYVAKLYQDAGAEEMPSEETIEEFVKNKVLPFILTGKK